MSARRRPSMSEELAGREAQALAAIAGPQLMDYTRQIARWVRLSGSPEERRAFEYVESVLRRLGVSTQLLEHDAFISLPGAARLEITLPQHESLPCITHAFAAPTGAAGISGKLAYVGQGTREEYSRVDVRGKIALVEGLAVAAKAQRAEAHGAIAHIYIHGDYTHETSVSPLWGAPTPETVRLLPTTPSFSVNREAGARLKRFLEAAPVAVRAWAEVETGWRKIPLLVGDLPGDGERDRFVLLSSHIDSWHYGAMDNAAANATVLEVVRVLTPQPRRRGLRVAFWSGHSHGRFAGSAWYADTHWHELYRRCVAHVNVDSTGGRNATVLEEVPVMAETKALAAELIASIGGQQLRGKRIGRFADQSFTGIGVASIFGTLSEQDVAHPETARGLTFFERSEGRAGGLGWWWHTPEDALDKIDETLLVRDTKIYLAVVSRLVNSPVLPLDYAATARELRERLVQYQVDSRGRLDLSTEISAASVLERQAQKLYQALREEDPSGDEARLRAINDTLMRLGRLLVPVGYTAIGSFDHDLGIAQPPVPGLAAATSLGSVDPKSDEAYLLKTALRRQANRVRFAIEEATTAIEALL